MTSDEACLKSQQNLHRSSCTWQHAYGETCWTEVLGSCSFDISPGAFFQTNTAAAELLYATATQHIPSNTEVLLDVCCGTGTIGLTCLRAGVAQRLIGVDICEPAIADAKRNAIKNGYTPAGGDDSPENTTDAKVKFVAGRAEDVLARQVRKVNPNKKVVAVVDPARDGLHGDVIRTLRMFPKIQRLVYISCNPTGSLVRDAVLLCAPPTKKYAGQPFRVVSATPVDIFPLTDHCEMVLVFDRLNEEEDDTGRSVDATSKPTAEQPTSNESRAADAAPPANAKESKDGDSSETTTVEATRLEPESKESLEGDAAQQGTVKEPKDVEMSETIAKEDGSS